MKTFYPIPRRSNPLGFTLIELLVAMTVIGILVGMLAFAVQRVLVRSREFAIQVEMGQLETAIEKFQIEYGFYPPSFKRIAKVAVDDSPQAAANLLLTYINRISPNNVEGSVIIQGQPERFVDRWWTEVGQFINQNPGSDLVFWLSGLSRDRQRPLTRIDPMNGLVANAAHDFIDGGDGVSRQAFFEFNRNQINVVGNVAQYSQSNRKIVPYRYLDASNYLPTNPSSTDVNDPETLDGAYVKPGVLAPDVAAAQNDPMLFRQIYPNPDSFQLIAFGLDGLPGVVMNPNDYSRVGPGGADNMVNFGPNGPGRLENLILEEN